MPEVQLITHNQITWSSSGKDTYGWLVDSFASFDHGVFQIFGQVIAILLPIVGIVVYYFIRKDVYDFYHAILGTFMTY